MPSELGKRAACLAAGGLLLLAGCQEPPPPGPATVPLQGRIEFTQGGSAKDLADKSVVIQFQSVDQPKMIAFGEILEDGSFTMGTQTEEGGKLGVVPGAHRVRLNADSDGARLVAPKFLRYETSGITVKAPVEGELRIKVSR
jgi:hypothetical protein